MRFLKNLFLAALSLVAGVQACFGFSLGGPTNSEPWQVDIIGFQLPGDIVTPKNLGEEYRRNYPVIYYYFDSNFRDYFGSNGVLAVEQAISVFNSLTNVSQYSPNLTEIPAQAARENYRAEAMFLTDLKSYTLCLLCEQMGLAPPERYVWCLHDREHFGTPPCPAGQAYTVVQRNFDPVPSALNQYQSSSYINGTLYSYLIDELCAPPAPPDAIALPFQVDPLDFGFTSIAGAIDANLLTVNAGMLPGRFWTGLTRDDVGGLRYLLRSGNVNYEAAGSNTVSLVTNVAPQLLVTSNLTLLADQALTNNAATLAGLYPGLSILSSVPVFTNLYTTNFTPYFTNSPYDPVGTPAHLAFVTNVTVTVATYYQHTFGNLFTIKYTANGWILVPLYNIPPPTSGVTVSLLTSTVGFTNNPFLPIGGGTNAFGTNSLTQTTNTTFVTIRTNDYLGDYVLLPTNLCSVQILFSQLTNVLSFTNQLASATNPAVAGNASGGVFSFTENIVTYFTNHIFVVNPVLCASNALAWTEGIERVSFVRIPDNGLDELTYSLYQPITNNYTTTIYDPTNNVTLAQKNQRTLVFPDIVFSARDMDGVQGTSALEIGSAARGIIFNASTSYGVAYQGLAGPGTIVPNTFIIYNKAGQAFANAWPNSAQLQAQSFQTTTFWWGSFDGTTNDPVVYPNGTSITNLESLFLVQILPLTLPNASIGQGYPTTTFSATGGQAPYTWSLAPGSPGLPPGLAFTSDGTLSGVPTQDGAFDFVIRLTDASGRVLDYNYTVTISL